MLRVVNMKNEKIILIYTFIKGRNEKKNIYLKKTLMGHKRNQKLLKSMHFIINLKKKELELL